MKHLGWIMCALLCAGCMKNEIDYKVGVTPLQRNRDRENCAQSATKRFPVANTYSRTPVVWVPPARHCHSKGCYSRAGYYSGGHVQKTDENLTSRKQAYSQCMARKGYQPIELPACTGKVKDALKRAPQGRYPKLTADACTTAMSDGTLKVYAP